MKPLRGPVFFRAIVILCFVLSIGVVKSSHNEIAHSRITRDIKDEDIEKTLKFVDTAIKSDLAKKLADNFKKIAPLLGIAGDAVTVALFFISDDDPNDERFKEMKSKLEVMDTKLDSIADQVNFNLSIAFRTFMIVTQYAKLRSIYNVFFFITSFLFTNQYADIRGTFIIVYNNRISNAKNNYSTKAEQPNRYNK